MGKLWNWIDNKNFSYEGKVRAFLLLNCLKYSFLGFLVWLLVSRVTLSTYDWAFCFVIYPGLFIGYLGGFLYICQQK